METDNLGLLSAHNIIVNGRKSIPCSLEYCCLSHHVHQWMQRQTKKEIVFISDETTLCTHRKSPTGYSNRMQFVALDNLIFKRKKKLY